MGSETSAAIAALCTRCGICCDGTLFHAVELQRGDRLRPLKAAGLKLRTLAGGTRFPQPCHALDGCLCTLYPDRPKHCRNFDCNVLKEVVAKRITLRAGLARIHRAKRLAAKIRSDLEALGNQTLDRSLRERFVSVANRIQKKDVTEEEAEVFGRLSERVHQLNLALSRWFYSGDE